MSDTRATARDLTPRRAEFHLWGRGAFSRAYDTYGCTRARQDADLRNGRSGTPRQQPATSQSGHKTRVPVVWYSQPCLSINRVSFVFLLFSSDRKDQRRSISPYKRFTDQETEGVTKLRHAFFAQHFLHGPHFKIVPEIHQAPRERTRVLKEEPIGIVPSFGSLFFGQAMRGQVSQHVFKCGEIFIP